MGLGLPVSLLLTAIGVASPSLTDNFDFSKSYAVWAQGNGGSCLYVVGDVYTKPADLKAAIATYRHKELGVEFLTNETTAAKCASQFEKAALKAGFLHYRSRLATQGDRALLHP